MTEVELVRLFKILYGATFEVFLEYHLSNTPKWLINASIIFHEPNGEAAKIHLGVLSNTPKWMIFNGSINRTNGEAAKKPMCGFFLQIFNTAHSAHQLLSLRR